MKLLKNSPRNIHLEGVTAAVIIAAVHAVNISDDRVKVH